MKIFIRLFFILTLSSAFLMASIGKIAALRGEATIERAKQEIVASMGMEIEKNDLIHTKSKAKLQIIFNDNTIITMGKNGDLAVNDYILDERKPKAEFKMFKGVFRTVTGQIGKIAPNRFKIKTKTATIGIRGTTVEVSTGNDGDAVGFSEGHGSVTSDATGETKNVGTGQMVTVTPDGKMSEVKVLDKKAFLNGDKKEKKKAKKEDSKKEKKDKKKESKKEKKSEKKADKKESKKSDKKEAKKQEKKESKKETKSDKKADKKSSKSENKQTKSAQKKSKPEAKKSAPVKSEAKTEKAESKSEAKSEPQESKSEVKESTTEAKQESVKSEQSGEQDNGVSNEKTDTTEQTANDTDAQQGEVGTDGENQESTLADSGTDKGVRGGSEVNVELGEDAVTPDGLDGGAQDDIAIEPVDVALDDTETDVPLDIPLDDVVVDDTATNDAAAAATDGAIGQATDEAVAEVINQDVQENVNETVEKEVVTKNEEDEDEAKDETTQAGVTVPIDDTVPVDETVPIDDTVPVDETVPVDDIVPVDETVPVDDTVPVDETVPVDDTVLVDETVPTDEVVIVSSGTVTTVAPTPGTYLVTENYADLNFGYDLFDISAAIDPNNISSYFIQGLNPVVTMPTQGEISYGGLVIGDNGVSSLIDSALSNFNIFVEFGASTQSISGYMSLLTTDGEAWNIGFTNGTTASTTVFGKNSLGSVGEIVSGSLSGFSFYGNNAQSIGGKFSLTSTSGTLDGAFIGNSANSNVISDNSINPSNIVEVGLGTPSGEVAFALGGENIMSVGYWNNGTADFDTWVNGMLTDVSQIETLIANNVSLIPTAYAISPTVLGFSSTGNKLTNGAINLFINFGSPTPLSGQISFDTTASWVVDIPAGGFLTPNNFGTNTFTAGTTAVTGISGFLNGSFFGTDAAAVGGEFGLTGTNANVEESVKGVFAVSKGGGG